MALVTDTLTLATDGDRRFDAYLARPASGRGPGLVLLTEMFGVNDWIKSRAGHYAGRGFAAIVPNLYWRSPITKALAYEGPERETAFNRLKAFDRDHGGRDIATAVQWLRGQAFCNGKVGALGFCAGGTMAFVAAARAGIDAAASLYGLGISSHLNEQGAVRCPMQIHYGENDLHVPREEYETVGAAVKGHATIEVFLYPAGHSFANELRPTYDAEACRLAMARVDRMLDALR